MSDKMNHEKEEKREKYMGTKEAINADHIVSVGLKDGFLTREQVLKIFPISNTTWKKGIKDGRFPPPARTRNRAHEWRVEDIEKLYRLVVAGKATPGNYN